MVYGIGRTEPKRRTLEGRPPLAPSTTLRTLAWLRYLLDNVSSIPRWAAGDEAPPTWKRRTGDVEALRGVLQSDNVLTISDDPLKRPVSLLDKLFSGFHGESWSRRWFSNRVLPGRTHPDRQQLKRIDDLMPGSMSAFDDLPAGLDAGFYDAIDFTSPWYGRLHLWRVIDPTHQDAAWDRLLEDGHDALPGDEAVVPAGFPRGAWRRRNERWKIRPAERRRLRDEIALAMIHLAYPEDLDDDPAFVSPRRIMHAARAACTRDPEAPNPIRDRIRNWGEARQWTALTDALAALRLDRIAVIDDRLAAWWVRSVAEGMAATIERRERVWFCPLPRNASPLATLIERWASHDPSQPGRRVRIRGAASKTSG